MRRLVNIADQMTDPDLVALERAVQPVMKAADRLATATVQQISVQPKVRKAVATAAMLVVAQARAGALRDTCVIDARGECVLGREHAQSVHKPLRAAEALVAEVERLRKEGA